MLAALRSLRAEEALLDGVLVAPDDADRPSADLLAERLAGHVDGPVVLYAFDLLHLDGWRVTGLPLLDRKRLLAAILPRTGALLHAEHVAGEGERLAATVAGVGLGGVVAKEAASTYRGGPSRSWTRIDVTPSAAAAAAPMAQALARSGRRRGGRARPTNREKVCWPGSGLTKGDLLDHYERVAEALLPHLHERPLHLRRFPDGIEGKSFYHKDAPDHRPAWVETEPIASGEDGKVVRYVICNDRDTLLWLVNLGSIDLHPWMSRRGSLDSPDRLVLDLDPDGTPFPQVARAARLLGRLLRGLGLRPYLKTSGASGLHVVVPLVPRYTYDQARMFAEMACRAVVRDHPDLCTVERAVARRKGRVYLDYLQNRRGQTVVPPWVVRPVPAASVSMPLDWDELDGDIDPARFTIRTAPARLAERGDLHRGVLDDPQEIEPALEAFREAFGER